MSLWTPPVAHHHGRCPRWPCQPRLLPPRRPPNFPPDLPPDPPPDPDPVAAMFPPAPPWPRTSPWRRARRRPRSFPPRVTPSSSRGPAPRPPRPMPSATPQAWRSHHRRGKMAPSTPQFLCSVCPRGPPYLFILTAMLHLYRHYAHWSCRQTMDPQHTHMVSMCYFHSILNHWMIFKWEKGWSKDALLYALVIFNIQLKAHDDILAVKLDWTVEAKKIL